MSDETHGACEGADYPEPKAEGNGTGAGWILAYSAVALVFLLHLALRCDPETPTVVTTGDEPVVLTFFNVEDAGLIPEPEVESVPLAEWVVAFGLDIGDTFSRAPVRVRPGNLGSAVLGTYEESIVRLDHATIADPVMHRGVLMHEIAHRYCGWHTMTDEWSKCAAALGVPERYRSESVQSGVVTCKEWTEKYEGGEPKAWDAEGNRRPCVCTDSDKGIKWDCTGEAKP